MIESYMVTQLLASFIGLYMVAIHNTWNTLLEILASIMSYAGLS